MATVAKKRTTGTTKDYSSVAARIIRPADRTELPRILVYGRNKKGKTTFSASADPDHTLILDPEKGTKEMKKRNPHVLPIAEWEETEEAWGFLRSGKHDYRWVSVDGLTKFNQMALKFVMKQAELKDLDRQPGQIRRQDYGASGTMMREMINKFDALPMGVVFTAQERMVALDSGDNDDDDETTYFVPDLPASVRGAVNSVVDVIGRIYTVKATVNGKEVMQRRLHIAPHERYDTGYRSDFSPPEMLKNPTIPRLIAAMRGETTATKKKEQ